MGLVLKTILVLLAIYIRLVKGVFNVKEDAQLGTTVGTIRCGQPSVSPPTISAYRDSEFNADWFRLSPNTTLHNNKTWDILVGSKFHSIHDSAMIEYRCRGDVAATPVRVILDRVNNYPPEFCSAPTPAIVNISEDTRVFSQSKQFLHTFNICDKDKRTEFTSFDILPHTGYLNLVIDGTMLKIQLLQQFNYDTMSDHVLHYNLTVTDSRSKNKQASHLVLKVHVTDADDRCPAFKKPLYNCQLPEGKYNFKKFNCSVTAEDQDRGLKAALNYTIVSVTPSTNVFTIDGNGVVWVSGSLDRENISTYTLFVMGFQTNRPDDRYNFTTIIVDVTDIDDHPPVMLSTTYRRSIMENTDNGVAVLQVAASDPDLGNNSRFSFAIAEPRNAFAINSSTGLISVRNSSLLDYENKSSKQFVFLAYAVPLNRNQANSGFSKVTISLIDVNDNAPEFQGQPFSFHISKNLNASSDIGQINATDLDTNTHITYHLVSQTEILPFSINDQTGVLTVTGKLYESYKPVYNLTVMVEDGPASSVTTRRSSAPVVVYVKDVNMFQPVFAPDIDGRIVNISEATTPRTHLLELLATDKDSMDQLSYSIIAGNLQKMFGLVHRSLYVKGHLDREHIQHYNLTVQVFDGSNNVTTSVSINIMDENDNSPVFEELPYIFNVTEEQPAGVFVGHITAKDRDVGQNAEIRYKLEDSPWSNNFSIDPNSGNITTNGKIDREAAPVPVDTIELVVIASDRGMPPRSNTTTININIEDVNDNKPSFRQSYVNLTLKEGFGPGLIYQAEATDRDRGRNSLILYKRRRYPMYLLPHVHVLNNGSVTTDERLEIANGADQFVIIVEAYNNETYAENMPFGVKRGLVFQQIVVNLTDINDHDPVFNPGSNDVTLPEDYRTGKVFKRVEATDADFTAEFNSITYWIVPPDESHFGIDSATGDLYLVEKLDYEKHTNHSFQVYASDMHTSTNNNKVNNISITVTIHVEDVNDNTPEFKQGPYNCSVHENFKGKLKNCNVYAEDGDKSTQNNQLGYKIIGNNLFTISGGGGAITLTQELDNENASVPHTFVLNVTARDNGSPSLTGFTIITVHLLNENDNVPKFNQSTFHFNVRENNSVPYVFGNILASDADGDRLTYDCNDPDFTFIDGTLTVNTALDYESDSSIKKLTITASDNKNTTAADVYVKILPVNEYPPVIHTDKSVLHVTENLNATFQFNVTDADDGSDGRISFEARVADEWKSYVSCNKDVVGSVSTCNILALDREKVEILELTLIASDHGVTSRTAAVTKTVKVVGVNDNGPYFNVSRRNITLTEGVRHRHFHTAQAKDKDIGNGSQIKYRLTSPHSSPFNVSSDGKISVGALEIDHSNQGKYTLEIEAYNDEAYQNCSSCGDGRQTVTVFIQDVNDQSPHFLNSSVVISVPENKPLGSVITRVVAVDDDFTEEFNTVIYWLDPTNKQFLVDSNSGDIYLINHLDSETKSNNQLTVYASDMKPNVNSKRIENATCTIMVNVTDVNDKAPEFISGSYNCSVPENFKGKLKNCDIHAKDGDVSTQNNQIVYQIDNNNLFAMVGGGNEIRLTEKLDYENASVSHTFVLNVTASDNGSPVLTGFTIVTVHLLNENDNAPVFNQSTFHFNVRENNSVPFVLGNIVASDADGDRITYDCYDSDFTFINGTLKINAALDYESDSSGKQFTISASDDTNTTRAVVYVHILPVNEYPPVIHTNKTVLHVTENMNATFHFNVTDADLGDDGRISLETRVADEWKPHVTCGKDVPGSVVTCTILALDREKLETFELTLIASDRGPTPRTAAVTKSVKVTGVNDNAPCFMVSQRNITLTEGVSLSNFYTALATDADKGAGSVVFYRLKDGNPSLFNISDNGSISTKALWIDDNNQGVYTITVEAFNREPFENCPACKNATQAITINLQDVNNYSPHFEKLLYQVLLKECTVRGTNITRVFARDKDTSLNFNTVTYWMKTNFNGTFRIDTHTGDIYLEKLVDYDPPALQRNFTLQIYATDLETRNVNSNHTAHATVNVTVEDCNDNPPNFSKAIYHCITMENTTQDFNCTVTATDVEDGSNILYTIVNETAPAFKIDRKGIISLKHKLDYEKSVHQFTVNVLATDSGTPPLKSTCTVYIQLQNLNDENPEFLGSPYSFNLYENTNPNVSSIGEVTVRDIDGDNVSVTIQEDNSGFWLSRTQELIPMKSFNYEAEQTIHLTLLANDTVHTSSAVITVHILDRNDVAPKFINESYKDTIEENVNISHHVVQVSAVDGDSSQNGNNIVTYSILEGDDGMFQIDSKSGLITTAKTLNASIREDYTLMVQAADNGTPQLLNITAVMVHVKDVNNMEPYFLYTPYAASIKENRNGTLLQVHGRDPDPSPTSLQFKVEDGDLRTKFWFKDNSLHATELDAERYGSKIDLNISVTDGVFKVYTMVHVTIIDENDNIPYFKHTPYSKTIDDTAKAGTYVLKVTAGDVDITNTNFTYILYGGFGDFIIERGTGIIKVSDAANLNYTRIPAYNMSVLVQDSGSPPKSNTSDVTILLSETNLAPPNFTRDIFQFNFPENNLSVSGEVQAVDIDGVTYTIKAGNDDNMFSLDKTAGVISLANGSLNYEMNRHQYSLVVEAKDKAAFPKSSTAKVTITVQDVNEPPSVILNPTNVFKERNSIIGAEVMIADSSDRDTRSEFRNLTYSLRDEKGYFKINPNTGKVTVKRRLDKAGNFSLNITVQDGRGLTDSGLIFVIVSNITGISLKTSVFENQTVGSLVYDLKNATENMTVLSLEIQKSSTENFKMKNRTVIVTNSVLDRETAPEFGYDLIINGKDTVNKIMKAQIQLHVTVLDVNDNPPNFKQAVYEFLLNEEVKVGSVVNVVTATDIDQKPVLTYSIANSSGYFNISSDKGVITVGKRIDFENLTSSQKNFMDLKVECFDGNSTATTDVHIKIKDINDNKPKFTSKFYTLILKEDHMIGLLPDANISATDKDSINQGKLIYNITNGNAGHHFSMDLSSGTLHLMKNLDFEDRSEFSLSILVFDGIYNDTATVNISVLDVNDNKPEFNISSYTFTTKEGNFSLLKEFVVRAKDLDSGNNSLLTYSFLKDEQRDLESVFKIRSQAKEGEIVGLIEVVSPLDRENDLLPHQNGSAVYTFTVVAKDHGLLQKTGSTKVTVYVTDINDCPPKFPPKFADANYTLDVQEGSPTGYRLLTISTTDCDYYSNYTTVSYSLLGDGSDHFNISQTGEITLNKPVRIQERASFDLLVSAFDRANTAKVSLRINVLDTNDHDPEFNSSLPYHFFVSENSTEVVVGYVSATDEDPGENGRVTYSITSGDGRSLFKVNSENGTITLTGRLDREKKDSYTLFITATDHAKAESRSDNCEVTITVTDENDNSPIFHPSDFYSCSIKEDSRNGTILEVIPQINATDADNGDNGTAGIQYRLTGNGSQLFCIDHFTGVIVLCQGTLNRENIPFYQLQLLATDRNGSLDGHSAMATLNITVTDVNDNIPQFIGNYEFPVSENTNTTASVGQVAITDADLPESNKIRYAIRSGGMGQFYIDPVRGSIHVSGALDREKQDVYHLNITVTDGKSDHINWTIVTINITDVNDMSPQFNQSVVEVSVEENQGAKDILHDSAFDLDEKDSKNSRISFSLKNDTENDDVFRISEHGILSTLKPLNREKRSSYTLTVIAKDHGDPQLSNEQTVTITVLDTNDNAPLFCDENTCSANFKEAHSYIVEKSPVGSVVALLEAKDIDEGDNGTVTYSIKGDTRKTQFFDVNSNTGLVTLKQSVDIQRLVDLQLILTSQTDNASLDMTVVATDKGTPMTLSTELELIVSVEELNDDAPVFKRPVFNFNVSEDLSVGSAFGKVEAIVNSSNPHLSYSKVSDVGTEKFDINEKTGEIKLKKLLDREVVSYYTFPVSARDGGFPERTAFAVVDIVVLDINDNWPKFLQDNYVFNIPENSSWTGTMNISATDRDEGNNAKLSYQLADNLGGMLSIGHDSGIVSLKQILDREINQTVVFTVVVYDGGIPSYIRNTSVTIHVLDVNDNAPTFINTPDIVTMAENNMNESFQMNATDPDAGLNGTVIFELASFDNGPFQINPLTGRVTLLEPLNYEHISQYNLTVLASDQGYPYPQQTAYNVTVNVLDVYDFVPECQPEVIETSIQSSVPVSTQVAQIYAGPGNLRYTLTGGPSEFFMVDKMDGKITTNHQLRRQTKQYLLTVTATDQVNNKTAACKVIVHILDSAVSFQVPSYSVNIPENLNVTMRPHLLIDLNSTEEIKGVPVAYTISGTDNEIKNKFWVDPLSGRVYCNTSLDRETKGLYEIYVTAHAGQARRKREVEGTDSTELGTVKLTVIVTDVNDNAPNFTDAQKQNKLFGVPSSAKANYLVTKLKTFDPDDDVNSQTLYKVVDGDTTVFGIDGETGEIRTLAAIAKSKKKQFDLTVMAIDMSEPTLNDTISLKIYAVDPSEQLVLTANMSITDFTKKSDHLISKMGEILGVKVQLEYSTPHKQPDGSLDLKSTDIFFHGLNETTNSLIPYDNMLELMKRNEAKLKKLFNMQLLEVEKVPTNNYLDPSKITVSQIALITMAVLIFFGSLLGVLLTLYSWQRLEESEETEVRVKDKSVEEIELESLRSRHSNRLAPAFINRTYDEIELATSKLAMQKKAGVQYESQELRLNFHDEIANGMVLHNGPVHRDNNGTYSMADSGVDNVSLHSSDQTRPGSNSDPADIRTAAADSSGSGSSNIISDQTDTIHAVDDDKTKSKEITYQNVVKQKTTTTAPALTFLNVDESPVMTSSPRISYTDSSNPGTIGIIFDRDHSNSETESTTDILEVDKTIPDTDTQGYVNVDIHDIHEEIKNPGETITDTPGYVNVDAKNNDKVEKSQVNIKEDTIKMMTTESMDKAERKKSKAASADKKDVVARSRNSSIEEADGYLQQRDRTSTLSFEEIGETNDEDETTQF